MTDLAMTTWVNTNDGRNFKWYVISEYNNHVLAMGVAKSRQNAERMADASAAALNYELTGVAT